MSDQSALRPQAEHSAARRPAGPGDGAFARHLTGAGFDLVAAVALAGIGSLDLTQIFPKELNDAVINGNNRYTKMLLRHLSSPLCAPHDSSATPAADSKVEQVKPELPESTSL